MLKLKVHLNQMHIATKSSKINTSSEKQLEEFAQKIGAKIKKGDTFFLFGEMGVGKTSFVKYLINNLQKKFKQKLTEVTSPTFNIMNEYRIEDLLIKHFDLYRLHKSILIRYKISTCLPICCYTGKYNRFYFRIKSLVI